MSQKVGGSIPGSSWLHAEVAPILFRDSLGTVAVCTSFYGNSLHMPSESVVIFPYYQLHFCFFHAQKIHTFVLVFIQYSKIGFLPWLAKCYNKALQMLKC